MVNCSISFVCEYCDEPLPVEFDEANDVFRSDKYHSCFGSEIRMVGIVMEDKIVTAKDGVRLNVKA